MDLPTEWVKPSGLTMLLNNEEATIEYAESQGWLRYSETEEGLAEAKAILEERERRAEATVAAASDGEDKPKRTRRTKEQMEADAAAG